MKTETEKRTIGQLAAWLNYARMTMKQIASGQDRRPHLTAASWIRDFEAAAAVSRESGGSFPDVPTADTPETRGFDPSPFGEPPDLNKSGGSDVEGK